MLVRVWRLTSLLQPTLNLPESTAPQPDELAPSRTADVRSNALLFGLHDRPPVPQTALAALAHLLAIVAGIATAPLLIALGLGLDAQTTAYVISSALVVCIVAECNQVLLVSV